MNTDGKNQLELFNSTQESGDDIPKDVEDIAPVPVPGVPNEGMANAVFTPWNVDEIRRLREMSEKLKHFKYQ